MAQYDALTGFLNRRGLDEAAPALIANCTERREALAVLVADLDSFKQVNDLYGHSAGDQVLQQCARRIAGVLPPRALAARSGGDEFVCLVPFNPGQTGFVDEFAASLIGAIASPSPNDETGLLEVVTVSIGIAHNEASFGNDDAPATFAQMLNAADVAMYHAKRHGRNRHFWHDPAMEAELKIRRELEAGIRCGIVAGEFVPYYEQQIDLATGKLTGFEMLARWNSPTYGVVGPQVFIPIAEEIGLIDVLSQKLIAQALQDAKAWDPALTLSVNISPIQLRDEWFAQKLIKQLVEANFPPQRLEVEITESCLHENVGAVRALLASLKNQGIKISLDDFGTGYSSLGQLSELPIDCIKIDRCFITNLSVNADNATIVEMITSLGKGLGLPIVAEGIETQDVLDKLQGYGDFRGQGYLYGQPEPACATNERLAALNLLAVKPEPDTENLPQRATGS
jgi:diguanylate cyclase (GGDEF)-like protein